MKAGTPMAEPHDGCMQHAGRPKTASGMTVYLMEELGDARLNCAHLTHYVDLARQIVEQSTHRDHIFEVAGHLLQAIPEHLFKLEKSLQAVALAADRLDYEEIKQELKPEKVQDLERALKDVRIRTVQRHSEPMRPMMNPQQAAEELQKIATSVKTSGKLPMGQMLALIAGLEGHTRTAEDVTVMAEMFETMSKSLLKPSQDAPKRLHLAATLRKMLAEQVVASDDDLQAAWVAGVKEVSKGSKEDLLREAPGEIRTSHQNLHRELQNLEQFRPSALGGPWGILSKINDAVWSLVYWASIQNTAQHGPSVRLGCGPDMACGPEMAAGPGMELEETPEEEAARRSRFEKGQPADPTQNMSPEDAEEWKKKNDEHKDNFKSASDFTREDQFSVFLNRMVGGIEDSAKQLRHSLEVYRRDPQKYAPQLSNLYQEAASLQGQLRVLLRSVPSSVKFAAEEVSPGQMALATMEQIKVSALVSQRRANAGNWKMALSTVMEVVDGVGTLLSQLGGGMDGMNKAIMLNREVTKVRRTLRPSTMEEKGLTAADEEHMSRFEEGKPADPTEHMSPEDAAKWKQKNDEHKDKFKAADWKAAQS